MKTLIAVVVIIAGAAMCVHPRYGMAEEVPGALLAFAGVIYLFGRRLLFRH